VTLTLNPNPNPNPNTNPDSDPNLDSDSDPEFEWKAGLEAKQRQVAEKAEREAKRTIWEGEIRKVLSPNPSPNPNPSPSPNPNPNPNPNPKVFNRSDTNKDGILTRAEIIKEP